MNESCFAVTYKFRVRLMVLIGVQFRIMSKINVRVRFLDLLV